MTAHRGRLPARGLAAFLVLGALALVVACRPPRETAGADAIPPVPASVAEFVVRSPAFEPGGALPAEFTCDGASASPPIEWSGAPAGTKCYALNVWHVPGPGTVKSYWVVTNIPANVTTLPKNATGIGAVGLNDKGRAAYDPMCSKGPGAKTYHITVHALSAELAPSRRGIDRAALLAALKETELGRGTLTFTYSRHGRSGAEPKRKRP